MKCLHATPDTPHRVRCNLGLYGGLPHVGVCQQCPSRCEAAPCPEGATVQVSVPRPKWPRAVQWLSRRAQPADVGVGDVVQRMLARYGAERVKAMLMKMGIDCGCGNRQAHFNARYPFPQVDS